MTVQPGDKIAEQVFQNRLLLVVGGKGVGNTVDLIAEEKVLALLQIQLRVTDALHVVLFMLKMFFRVMFQTLHHGDDTVVFIAYDLIVQ